MNLRRRPVLLTIGCFFLLPLIVGLTFPSNLVKENPSQPHPQEKKRMQVSLERTGGFAGIPMTISVDAETLSPEQVTQLQQLIESSNFFHLPQEILGAAQPDRFQYQITVENQGERHEVMVDESAMPPSLKPLLDWLMQTMRQQQKR